MTRPYPQLSPFALARGEATAGAGGDTGALPFKGAMVTMVSDIIGADYTAGVSVPFDKEEYDIGDWHDNVTNNTRLTVPSGVTRVRVTGGLILTTLLTGEFVKLKIQKNGTDDDLGLTRQQAQTDQTNSQMSLSSGIMDVVEGDYFEINVTIQSDTTISLSAGRTFLSIEAVVSGRPSLLHVRQEETDGTAGGTLTAATWNVRVLNTVPTNEISGASVASNQITLPAGTYEITANAMAYLVNGTRLRLRDTTGVATLIAGMNANAHATASSQMGMPTLRGRFTLTVTSVLELQQWAQATRASDGAGIISTDTDEVEVYADVMIEKVS